MINVTMIAKFGIIGNAGDKYVLIHAREYLGGSLK